MVKVNAQHIMALRRLTDQPISACRDALVEAGGDLLAVIHRLRWSPCCGIYASDAELSAVLAEYGVVYTPEVRPEPVILPDAEVLAELTACGTAISDYFLIDGMVCSVNARGELMACVIEDEDLAVSAKAYLRRLGVPEHPSLQAFREQRGNA
ncbi:MAG: hypothetical protein U0793_29840 [Gemmataceae bacterium]